MFNAIVLGATGLTGSVLLKQLLNQPSCTSVLIPVRRSTGINHPKLKEMILDMEHITEKDVDLPGDVVFNCLGTTIKQAGSQVAQQYVDRDLPIYFAKQAKRNGAKMMINISSIGASLTGNFYLKTKAEMEAGTKEVFGEHTYHFRPSFLVGQRKESRIGESIGIVVMKLADHLLFGSMRKYHSMPVEILAKAMLKVAEKGRHEVGILMYDDILNTAN
ncbi:MAG: hypothetical protein JNJ58_04365 [Chitinophagaceae bacterium]|nr:hypothetical protein [Chitinophagaceae bacterium]